MKIILRNLILKNKKLPSLTAQIIINEARIKTPDQKGPKQIDEDIDLQKITYSCQYDNKVDIYAFGMTLLEIITNEPPYSECSVIGQVLKKKINGELPKSIDKIDNIHIK